MLSKDKRTVLIFFNIHPLNFPIIFFLSFFYRIVFWKYERLSFKLIQKFEYIDGTEFFEPSEWWGSIDKEIFDNWVPTTFFWKDHPMCVWSLRGLRANFDTWWLQHLAISYESVYRFLLLAEKWSGKYSAKQNCKIVSPVLCQNTNFLRIKFPDIKIKQVSSLACFDYAWQWANVVWTLFKNIITLLKYSSSFDKNDNPAPFFFTWHSAQDISNEPNRIDFTFLCERNFIKRDDCLFLLPTVPSEDIKKILTEKKVRWLTHDSYSEKLSVFDRSSEVLHLLKLFLIGCWRLYRYPVLLTILQGALQAHPWVAVGKKLKIKAYISTVSASWPERPEVVVMNALGVRTINWFYSANLFNYSSAHISAPAEGITHSGWVSREVLVWNVIVQQWMSKRCATDYTTFKAVGPAMCGDFRLLYEKSETARKRVTAIQSKPLVKYISVFDIPCKVKTMRMKNGLAPNLYPMEMTEVFFQDITEILNRFSNINLIIKLKRSLENLIVKHSDSLRRLIDFESSFMQEKRVIVLDFQSDPYLPVAMADFCIGLPFVSPILAGLALGKPGIFHDPFGKFTDNYPCEIPNFMTRTRKQLLEAVERWLDEEESGTVSELFKGPQFLRSELDPAEQMANIMLGDEKRSEINFMESKFQI